jgi:photosystem II stability/assembly factor-like uncharacterized protein
MTLAVPSRTARGSARRTVRGVLGLLATLLAGSLAAHAAEAAADGPREPVKQDRRLDSPAPKNSRPAQSAMLALALTDRRIIGAGERGLVAYSDDCGAHWQQGSVPLGVTLTALQMVDSMTGWAIGHGGAILATHDGGAHWQKQLDGRAIAQLALEAARRKMATANSPGFQQALRDADRLVADGPDKPLFAMHFWSSKRGIVVGAYGLALITEDGGVNWQWIADRVPNPKGLHLYGLLARGDEITIVGEQGFAVQSIDGGRQFQPVASPYAGSWFGIVGKNPGSESEALVYGLRGHVFGMTKGAFEPTRIEGPSASVLTALPRSDASTLLFDAEGQVYELSRAQQRAKLLGASPVGPVLSAASGCNGLLLAGLRGIALVDPVSLIPTSEKKRSQ